MPPDHVKPAPAVRRSLRGGDSQRHGEVAEAQRVRLLYGMLLVAGEEGYSAASVERVLRRVRISRRTFYDLYSRREELFCDLLGAAFERLVGVATEAYAEAAGAGWARGVRAGVVEVLALMNAEPHLARVCVVESLAAGSEVRELRRRGLARLAALIEEARADPRCAEAVPAGAGAGVLGSAQELLHDHVTGSGAVDSGMVEVARQVTYLVIAPYLGVRVAAREAAAAAREIDRRLRMASAEHAPPDELDGLALTDLQRRCLAYVATHPGCSSTRIAGAMGVRHVAQASRLMRILREANLATARPRGTAYEWTVTPLGEAALQVLERPAEPAWLARAAALSGTARCRRT